MTINESKHKAGFVSIVGKPNVGKSTLMNHLVGEKLSIITSKAQTTRHRILGIINGDDFQVVYSDTPGMVNPRYELHTSMMRYVRTALSDADLLIFVCDLFEKYNEDDVLIDKVKKTDTPIILVLNKIDLGDENKVRDKLTYWKEIIKPNHSIAISALHGANIEELLKLILDGLPYHPPYYPKDMITDRPERFFASEIVREKIFTNYKKEVPYSSEVVIESFKEEEKIIRIRAEIYVERATQRAILLGHKGSRIKKVGIEARKDLEAFFGKHVYLEQYIKVAPDWRKKSRNLRNFGYDH